MSSTTAQPVYEIPNDPLPPGVPLCVDLDGTLVKSDTLLDSVIVLTRQHPAALLQFPKWLTEGKAAFKRHITSTVQLDVVHLPYNRHLLQYLEKQKADGREIYLATGADAPLAQRVADHLGLFTGVLASDGTMNLIGKNKLAAFQSKFGNNFCYIGNAHPDVALLANCMEPMVANPHGSLSSALRSKKIAPSLTFTDRAGTLKAWLKAIRLHQWAKNTLIFLPLLLAHDHSPVADTGCGDRVPVVRAVRLGDLYRERPAGSRGRPQAHLEEAPSVCGG